MDVRCFDRMLARTHGLSGIQAMRRARAWLSEAKATKSTLDGAACSSDVRGNADAGLGGVHVGKPYK